METVLSFPGLGIGEFTLNKVAFSIGSLTVRWYGVIITLGIIAAFFYAYFRSKETGLVSDDLLDIGIFTVISGVIGARLYYVISSASAGRDVYNTFFDVIDIRRGGLAIYGGIIGGMLAIWLTCVYKKIRVLKLFDMIGPGVMLAQAMGRWGNFFNGEAHGGVIPESSPLYFLRMGVYENGAMQYVHPTFFYESLWNVIGFILINIFYRKRKFDGQIAMAYIAWYGFGRMFIEGLRTDSLYIGMTGIRVSQLLGLLCFLGAGAIFVVGWILSKRGKTGVADNVYLPGAKRLAKQAAAAVAATDEPVQTQNGEEEPSERRKQETTEPKDGEGNDHGDSD